MNFGFVPSYVALWALVLFQGLLVLAVLQKLEELRQLAERGGLTRDDWLPAGSPAPQVTGLDFRSGRPVSSRDLDGRGGLILFLSPECSVCKGLADSLRQPATDGLPPIIAFCQGSGKACATFAARLGYDIPLVLDEVRETATSYRVSGFPTAVVVDSQHRIRGYGNPENVEAIRRLVARSQAGGLGEAGSKAKSPATALSSR